MKYPWQLPSLVTILLLGLGSGCQDAHEATKVAYEAEETVIIRGDTLSDTQGPSSSPQLTREVPAAASAHDVAASDDEVKGSAAAKSGAAREITLGKRFVVTVPSHWIPKAPAVSFIEHEFTVPARGQGAPDGRVTFSSASGGVQANIERWTKQFRFPLGEEKSQQVKRKLVEVDGEKVHLVDLAGTYLEPSGPMMAERIEREGYRMLGAIIECDDGFLYFIKFYGPEATVAENESAFQSLITSLRKVRFP
ncbi:MAG: hypothetical protein ACUVQG_03155 [Thermogutta sp.]